MVRNYDDSQRFLEEHLELVCEETANYLVVWCIDLEIEEVWRSVLPWKSVFDCLFFSSET